MYSISPMKLRPCFWLATICEKKTFRIFICERDFWK